MNKININNYEAFYLDYLEGNLDKEDTALLLSFLDENPELKIQPDNFDDLNLKADSDISFDKEILKQNINNDNAEDYIIASVENELNEEDSHELDEFLKTSPELQKIAERYKKTILSKPDIIYPEKEKLKRKTIPVYHLNPLLKLTAASILVFLLIRIFMNINSETENIQHANTVKIDTLNSEKNIPIIQDEQNNIAQEFELKSKDEIKNATKEIENVQEKIKEISVENLVVTEEQEKLQTLEPEKQKLANIKTQDEKPENIPEEKIQPFNEEKHKIVQVNDSTRKIKKQDVLILANVTQVIDSETSVKSLNLKQWVNKSFRKNVLKKEKPSTDRIEGREILVAVVNKIAETSNADIAYHYAENDQKTSYSFSVGKFEFSRTKMR